MRYLTWLGLLGLCAAYLQGGLNKLLDFQGGITEATHFGLPFPVLVTIATIVLELGASLMILANRGRWIGAAALGVFTVAATFIALRYWEMPPGMPRVMAANAFYEHLGLAGAFLLVAVHAKKTPHE